jgi:hypothetical protein
VRAVADAPEEVSVDVDEALSCLLSCLPTTSIAKSPWNTKG